MSPCWHRQFPTTASVHLSRTATTTAAATVALLLAGCGASNTPPTGSSSAPKSGAEAAYRFSACMREHGVSNFPDPVVHSSGAGHEAIGIAINPTISGSPAFKSAQKACQGILPAPLTPAQQAAQQRYRQVHLLAFAQCMRSHGINSFPDPNPQGQIPPSVLQSAGINIHLPNVITAARACVPASGGILTQAAITQATSGGSSSNGGG